MLHIAKAEFIQMLRDPLVLFLATVVPLAMSAFFVWAREGIGGSAVVAALVTAVIPAFVLYTSTTTTLTSRRQSLFLKRMRSTALSDPAILVGLSLLFIVLSVAQSVVILAVLGGIDEMPSSPIHIIAALLLLNAMFFGFALATAGLMNSPESAQIAVLPITMGVVGIASWVSVTGLQEMAGLKLALPGGAAAELIVRSWAETPSLELSLLALPTFGWVILAIIAARVFFTWEPRR